MFGDAVMLLALHLFLDDVHDFNLVWYVASCSNVYWILHSHALHSNAL